MLCYLVTVALPLFPCCPPVVDLSDCPRRDLDPDPAADDDDAFAFTEPPLRFFDIGARRDLFRPGCQPPKKELAAEEDTKANRGREGKERKGAA